jgi:hypothetical protein
VENEDSYPVLDGTPAALSTDAGLLLQSSVETTNGNAVFTLQPPTVLLLRP